MKTRTLFTLLYAISMIACNHRKISIEDIGFDKYFFNEENIPIVKGKVLNLTPDEIENIKIEYSIVTPFEQDRFQTRKYGRLSSDGTFELEIDDAFPYQQIWLHVGNLFYAGIYANSDLFIELNADSLRNHSAYMNGSGVSYLGSDGELNAIMNNQVLFLSETRRDIDKEIWTLVNNEDIEYPKFKYKYDSLFTILHKIDNEFIEKNPSRFSWLIKNERMSQYYSLLCTKFWTPNKLSMSDSLIEEIKNHRTYLVSNNSSGFYNYLLTYLALKAECNINIEWRNFRDYSKFTKTEKESFAKFLQIKEMKEKEMTYDTTWLKENSQKLFTILSDTLFEFRAKRKTKYIDSLFDAPKSDVLKMKLSSMDPKEQKILMEAALCNIQTKWCKTVTQSRYENSQKKLVSIEEILNNSKSLSAEIHLGEPITEMSFGAKLYKVDTMDYEKLLSNLKTANKSKALIIDFWATWCAPCLQELENNKDLQKEVKDLPLEFVFLCTSNGTDIDEWKSKIAEFKIGGTHIFVEQEIENKLMTLFSVSGFPSTIFINKEGEYQAGAIDRLSYLNKNQLETLID